MPLQSYADLQASVLTWLARPGDPLVAPHVPDMVALFEAEARRRLRYDGNEYQVGIKTAPGLQRLALPARCQQVRGMWIGGQPLRYAPPGPITGSSGLPRTYTIVGEPGVGIRVARLDPRPDAAYTVTVLYYAGLVPLSDGSPTNSLLAMHPDAYLWGSLAEAEPFIGHDERVPLWLQRREAVFASIEAADRKNRWPGGLQIGVDGITVPASRGGPDTAGPVEESTVTVSATPPSNPADGELWFDTVSAQLFIWWNDGTSSQWTPTINQGVAAAPPADPPTVAMTPASGDVVALPHVGSYWIATTGPLAALTLRLPGAVDFNSMVEIGFAGAVTALTVTDAAGTTVPTAPTSASGPGAALLFRFVQGAGWVWWQ